ncbi:hypothetical protein HL653_17400 [Sphingomonas sp. AP4-R1]|uniref:hypothetical protein n=1 Tax=Sphingomonas sp. AP4-R1 TaxID=2735134 RepID=UPI001493AD20|nr:hypothetical protein [Sphingomonas sp. AP4-R1]QJU59298.1 hypothetical protein HL653_17400 [Sphingomonas sp. AP4-R1]
MSDFVLDIARADDMLLLRIACRNLALDPDASLQPRRLVRVDPDQPAILIVSFPPQHVAEQCFQDSAGPLAGTPTDGRRIGARLSGESRLVFRLPPDQPGLDLTLASLLDWSGLTPFLWRDLADGSAVEEDPDFGVQMPQDFHTAIELPYRLTLSPDVTERWEHRTDAYASPGGATELWHTRLTWPGGRTAAMWAIWSPDHPEFNPLPNPFPMAMTSDDRSQIVQISGDRNLLDLDRFLSIQDEQQLTQDQLGRLYAARAALGAPIWAKSCMLTSQGGYLDATTTFDFPRLGADLIGRLLGHDMDGNPGDDLFSIGEWSHRATLGRDHHVRILHHGMLLPFGHRADKAVITERKFAPGPAGEQPAYLAQHEIIIVHDPVRTYTHHDLPFTEVAILSPTSPPLDTTSSGQPLTIGGARYLIPMAAIDHDGNRHPFAMPAIFVADGDDRALSAGIAAYQDDPTLGRVPLGGSAVAFAPGTDTGGARIAATASAARDAFTGDPVFTRLETTALSLFPQAAGLIPPVLPKMASASVKLPVVGELSGSVSGSGATIRYHSDFALGGFQRAAQEVFATVDRFDIGLPAESGGGLAAPKFAITGLSRAIGAISNVDAVVSANINPAAELALAEKTIIEGLGGKLLGVVDLAGIVAPAELVDHLPKLDTRAVAGGRELSFRWTPKCHVGNDLPAPLKVLDGSGGDAPTLTMTGSIFVPIADGAGSPHQAIDGTITNVSLVFADVLGVTFSEIGFHSKTGSRLKFNVKVAGIIFTGDLSFVQELTKILESIGLGDSVRPTIALGGDNVSVGMTITLPDATMGVLTLSNIAVSSSVKLYFAERPAEVTFGLSSQANPFLVAYTIFGGGGFFALTSTTSGDVTIAAGFQFGAMAELNLVVLKGAAQVMVGFSFANPNKVAVFTGFVRIFGSLEILGIVTISIDFTLTLTLTDGVASGTARLTIMVRLLVFSKSVSFSVTRSFSSGGGLSRSIAGPQSRFVDMMTTADWQLYCDAFA